MKRLFAIILVLFIIPLASASEDIYSAEQITTDVSMSSTLHLTEKDSNSKIEYVKASLYLFPRDSYQQEVGSIKTVPQASEEADSLEYRWDNPSINKLEFSMNAEVTANAYKPKIKAKAPFPIKTSKYQEYTEPSEMIDSDSGSIIDAASELAEGEDDQFMLVSKIGRWVRENVEYNLSSSGANAVKEASWVLKNKQGVCDELTNLFIALSRSLGIPSRYVSGVAYTNYNGKDDWGPHAWAEVYFPEYGWVPFDVTYGQFGYVDASHIIFRQSVDSNEPSTDFEWRGINTDLSADKLDIDITLVEKTGKIPELIRFTTTLAKDSIGFGSYNLVEVEVENLADQYVAKEIFISKPQEVELLDENNQLVILKPREKKKIYWIIKLDSYLNQDFIYTLPIAIYTQEGNTVQGECKARYTDTFYSREEIESLKEDNGDKKTITKTISLSCSANKDTLLLDEKADILCKIKNTGNSALDGLKVCLSSQCQTTDIKINQENLIGFTYTPTSIGRKSVVISARKDRISETENMVFEVIDEPNIAITQIEHPQSVNFGDGYTVSFTLNKTSFVEPSNIEIILDVNGFKEKWTLETLKQNKKVNVHLKADNLDEGKNDITVSLIYNNNKGEVFTKESSSTISIGNLNFIQKIQVALNKFGLWLNSFIQ